MASYAATLSTHQTAASGVADAVTLEGDYEAVEVVNRGGSGSGDIYFTVDGAAPTIGAGGTFVVAPGSSLTVPSVELASAATVVRLIASATTPYSVAGVTAGYERSGPGGTAAVTASSTVAATTGTPTSTADNTVTNASETILAANANRKAAIIQVVSGGNVRVRLDGAAATTTNGTQLVAGGAPLIVAMPYVVTGAITAIREGSNDGVVHVTEDRVTVGIGTARRPTISFPRRLTISPHDVRNKLTAWYDASQIVGLADAAAVSQWNDLGPAGRHQVQATADKQPTYRTNVVNGLPVVRFTRTGVSATEDFLSCASVPSDSAGAVFSVVRLPTAAADRVWLMATDSAGLTGYWGIGVVPDPGVVWNLFMNPPASGLNFPGKTTSPVIVTVDGNGTTNRAYVNGAVQTVTVGSGSNAGRWFDDALALDNYSLGGLVFGGNALWPLGGDICEIIHLNELPSDAVRNGLTRYLGAKWGIAVT